MYCSSMLLHVNVYTLYRELSVDIGEAVASLMWSAPLLQAEVQELKPIADQFALKYGKQVTQQVLAAHLTPPPTQPHPLDPAAHPVPALTVPCAWPSEKLMRKLAIQPPSRQLIEGYLVEIAHTYNVPFEPDPLVCPILLHLLLILSNMQFYDSNGMSIRIYCTPNTYVEF